MRLLLLISLSGCLILLAQAKPVSDEVRINGGTGLEDVEIRTAPSQLVGIRGRRFVETSEAAKIRFTEIVKTEQNKAVGANGTDGRDGQGGEGGQGGNDGLARQSWLGGQGGNSGTDGQGGNSGTGGHGGSSGKGGQAGRQIGTGGQNESGGKGGLGGQSRTGGQARHGGTGGLAGRQGGNGGQAGRQGGTCGYGTRLGGSGSRSIRQRSRIYRLKRKNGSPSGQDGFSLKSQKSPAAAKPDGFVRHYMLHSVPN